MLHAVETGSPSQPQPKFGLRESLLQDILGAIAQARSERQFTTALQGELEANADLRGKIWDHRTNGLISHKYILGYLPRDARATVGQFITTTLHPA